MYTISKEANELLTNYIDSCASAKSKKQVYDIDGMKLLLKLEALDKKAAIEDIIKVLNCLPGRMKKLKPRAKRTLLQQSIIAERQEV